MAWYKESARHRLARLGVKTKGSYKTRLKRYNNRIITNLAGNIGSLGLVNRANKFHLTGVDPKVLLSSRGIDIDNLVARGKVNVNYLSESDYDNLPEEKERNSKGEMSYAQTKITPHCIDISIRDTKDKRLVDKLLQHEKEELAIYNVIRDPDKAHEMTVTKVNDEEVDRAYGDIGDPS